MPRDHDYIMKIPFTLSLLLLVGACDVDVNKTDQQTQPQVDEAQINDAQLVSDARFEWVIDRVGNTEIARYKVPGFDSLSLQQKKLAYYLARAGQAGRDIIWDQKYRHNLSIRRALEAIVSDPSNASSDEQWTSLIEYTKSVFIANGIHGSYGNKIIPGFDQDFFSALLEKTDRTLNDEAMRAMFDQDFDNKLIATKSDQDILLASASNFYAKDISNQEVDKFYAQTINQGAERPPEHGLNSKIERSEKDGSLFERTWRIGGLYSDALVASNEWRAKAIPLAENEHQENLLKLYSEYYKTGDLKTWDYLMVAWLKVQYQTVGVIQAFVETYHDPRSTKGSYESTVYIADSISAERTATLRRSARWFENNSPTSVEHKNKNIRGNIYKSVNIFNTSGSTYPINYVSVNLPNSNWLRSDAGWTSFVFGNIHQAHGRVKAQRLISEFAHDDIEVQLDQQIGDLAWSINAELSSVLGYPSGKPDADINPDHNALNEYAEVLNATKAATFSLYFMLDQELLNLDLIPSADVGKSYYDHTIRHGLLTQLINIERNTKVSGTQPISKQLIAQWVLEHGREDGVISEVTRDNKTYFEINDYKSLQFLFGQLLKKSQRIISQGDYASAKLLVDNYGVNVDPALHEQVLNRVEAMNLPSWQFNIGPRLVEVVNDKGDITDIVLDYSESFLEQNLRLGREFSSLGDYN